MKTGIDKMSLKSTKFKLKYPTENQHNRLIQPKDISNSDNYNDNNEKDDDDNDDNNDDDDDDDDDDNEDDDDNDDDDDDDDIYDFYSIKT